MKILEISNLLKDKVIQKTSKIFNGAMNQVSFSQ